MKPIATFAVVLMIISKSIATAGVEEQAKTLVEKTVEKIYSSKFGQVWESFSESSRNEYRKAFLERVTVMKNLPPSKPMPPSPFDATLVWDAELGKMVPASKVPLWERQLTTRGFSNNLTEVAALSNQQFWETFLSEQYLKDRDYHAPVAPLDNWPKGKSLVPVYRIEAVAVEGDHVFVILKVPAKLKQALFSLSDGSSSWFYMNRERLEGIPDSHFVWTGTISKGKLQLDVPELLLQRF